MSFLLERESTQSTPYVIIDEKEHYMKLEGMSFHENTIEFFQDILKWLNDYLPTDFGSFTFDCKMKYFNSSTTKILFDILELMNDNAINGNQVIVNWYVNQEDDMLIELCEDIEEDYDNLTIKLIIS